VGIEIDPDRVQRIKDRLTATGIQAQIIQADFMAVNLSPADVVSIYLSDTANTKLAPKLEQELKPGTRIVSLDYTLPGWTPEKQTTTKGQPQRTLHLYKVSKIRK
jgi:predicted RNA methylase